MIEKQNNEINNLNQQIGHQQSNLYILEQTILKGQEHESHLLSSLKARDEENSSLQQTVEYLQQDNEKLNNDIFKLQQENYDLQKHSTNMIGEFPATETTISAYTHFGLQRMVGFISQYEGSVDVNDLIAFMIETTSKVRQIVSDQYSTISLLFPGHTDPLADCYSTLTRELVRHLQNNYKKIMSVELWFQRHNTDLFAHFHSSKLNLRNKAHLHKEAIQMAIETHDLFWRITLSLPKLQFGPCDKFNPNLHQNPFSVDMPQVILPPIMKESVIVSKGFAY